MAERDEFPFTPEQYSQTIVDIVKKGDLHGLLYGDIPDYVSDEFRVLKSNATFLELMAGSKLGRWSFSASELLSRTPEDVERLKKEGQPELYDIVYSPHLDESDLEMRRKFRDLSGFEEMVMRLSFGLDDGRENSPEEIAQKFGVPSWEVVIALATAIDKMKH